MHDFRAGRGGPELVLEDHAEQGNPGFHRELAVCLHPGDQHGDGAALGGGEAAARPHAHGPVQGGVFRVRVPGVPVRHIFIDAEQHLGRGVGNCAVFDLHKGLMEEGYLSAT